MDTYQLMLYFVLHMRAGKGRGHALTALPLLVLATGVAPVRAVILVERRLTGPKVQRVYLFRHASTERW